MIFTKIITAISLTGLIACANAASISLNYVGEADVVDGAVQVFVGDIVTFDVLMDFTDEPTIGGGFDILFDTTGLAYGRMKAVAYRGSVPMISLRRST